MSVVILYTDLRCMPSKLSRHEINWIAEQTALFYLQKALGETLAEEVDNDLRNNSSEIIVGWYDKISGDICDMGGTGSLDWITLDSYVLTISYENELTTEQQIDESIEWTLKQKF